jgi:LPXTG-site transpeptidase (sortase) family protein
MFRKITKIAAFRNLFISIFMIVWLFVLTLLSFQESKAQSVVGQLAIPAINLDSDIVMLNYYTVTVQGQTYLEWQVDDNMVGWHNVGEPLLESGNSVLNGHSDIKGMVFSRLNEVKLGDTMLLNQSYLYTVTDRVIVTEAGATIEQRVANAKWLLPTDDHRLTLITCISGTNRLIVVAKR